MKKLPTTWQLLPGLFQFDQFIFSGPQTNFFRVFQRFLPMDVRVAVHEVVVVMMPLGLGQIIGQLAVRHGRCSLAGIDTGLVDGYGVKGSKHADVRQDSRIIFTVTVTVRGNIHGQVDVEGRPVLADGLGIFGHLAIQLVTSIPLNSFDRIKGAGADATAAALAQILINVSFFVFVENGIGAAFLGTTLTAAAQFFVDRRLA